MSKPPEIEIAAKYPIRDIALTMISTPARMRKLRPETVKELAESMKVSGLIQPIVIRPKGAGYQLVVGEHRLTAAQKLRWAAIKCLVRDDLDDDAAALVELDENLVRADLTPAEEAKHLARRKALWERRQAEVSAQVEPKPKSGPKGGRPKSSFAAATAKKTGAAKSSINRKTARAEKIAFDVLEQIVGSEWDKGTHLDHLAGLTHEEQRQAILGKPDRHVPPKPAPRKPAPTPAAPTTVPALDLEKPVPAIISAGDLTWLGGGEEPLEMSDAEGDAERAEAMSVFLAAFAGDCNRHSPELVADHVNPDDLPKVWGQVRTIRKWLGDFTAVLDRRWPDPHPYAAMPEIVPALEQQVPTPDGDDLGDIPACLDRRRRA